MKRLRNYNQGYTLVEVITVLGVTAFFISLIVYFGVSYQRYGYRLEADSETLVTRLDLQDNIRENLGSSSGMITQNSIQDNAALNPDTTIPGNQYWTPLHSVPQTITVSGTGTVPLAYYRKYSVNKTNQYIYNGVNPYEDEYVMYIDKGSRKLYLRTLANPSAANNKAKTTCAPASATANCPADKVIGTELGSISTRYFSRSGNTIDWTSVYDTLNSTYAGPDYPAVEVVEFSVKIATKPALEKSNITRNTTVIRIALRNT